MNPENHTVLVLDDDRSVVNGLQRLLSAHGYKVRAYLEFESLFREGLPGAPACLILDNQLRDGMTGMQVHQEMQRRGWEIPTVFLTAHWNVQSVVKAMRAGADGFLTKPFEPAELLSAVSEALDRASRKMVEDQFTSDVRKRSASLTQREKEVVKLVVAGKLNKEIADILNLALVTVKVHRGRAMRKLGAGNAAELARIAGLCGILD
jgi:FixJ family two-component response regulator